MLRTFVSILHIAMMANAEWIATTTGLPSGTISGFDAVNLKLSWEEDYSSRQSISLTLKRNTGFKKTIPIYSLDMRDGKVKQTSEANMQDTTFYQDVEKLGAISFTKTTDGRLDMKGTFAHQAIQYSIEPYHPKIHKRNAEIGDHIIVKEDISTASTSDYVLPHPSAEQSEILQQSDQINNSSKDFPTPATPYEVKLYVLVDSYLYKNLSTLSKLLQWELGTDNFVSFYMGNLVNEVDIRYKAISKDILNIATTFSYLHTAKTAEENPYNQQAVDAVTLQANATLIFTDFTDWVKVHRTTLPKYAAHYMLQTSLDLRLHGEENNGLSKPDEACRDLPVSVCRYRKSNTAAHELAHSLGAADDGDGNECNPNDLYVMAPQSTFTNGNTIGNRFKFSPCSIKSIQSYIQSLTDEGKNCLINEESVFAWDHNTAKKLGRVLSADRQCQIAFGTDHAFVGGTEYANNMCHMLQCISLTNGSANARGGALQYTTCGDKKWCDREICVQDRYAPPTYPAGCPYGDQKGFIDTKLHKSCAIITGMDCYNSTLKAACCASCLRFKTGPAGCEYGDQADWCSMQHYPYSCNSNDNVCCASCRTHSTPWLGDSCPYGDKEKWCEKINGPDCYNNTIKTTCCALCVRYKTGPAGCEYGDQADWCSRQPYPYTCNSNGNVCCASCRTHSTPWLGDSCPYGDKEEWCEKITGFDCYNNTIKSTCCGSCQKLKTGPAGCEYGDKADWCPRQNYPYTCNSNGTVCCESCRPYSSPWRGDSCPYGDKESWCVNMAVSHCSLNDHRQTCCQKCCTVNCTPLTSAGRTITHLAISSAYELLISLAFYLFF